MKKLSGNTIAKFLIISIFCSFFVVSAKGQNLSIVLSSSKSCYMEEEPINLKVSIKNISRSKEQLKFDYLEPIENNDIFVPSDFKLEIDKANIQNFTNWIPPEPNPGLKYISLKPAETVCFNLPFTWYYYSIHLPVEFNLRLCYKHIYSNTLLLKIIPTAGKKEDKNFLINGNFSQGNKFPFGWYINNKNVSWIHDKHIILFTLDKNTAEEEGVWFYSIFYPVKSPSLWKLSMQAKTSGQQLIVFVEGWGIVHGRKRLIERNDCFFHPSGTKWETYTSKAVFENPDVKWLRLKIFAYLTAGKVFFRNIDFQSKVHSQQKTQ